MVYFRVLVANVLVIIYLSNQTWRKFGI